MRQHNHWKLSNLQQIIVKIGLWIFGLALLFFGTIQEKDINFNMVSQILGIICIVLALFLFLFEKVLWKTKIMNFPLFEEYWTPNLDGRWVGKLIRDGKPHEFVIEINQSFNKISCVTYSTNSSSVSNAAEILYNQGIYKFIYYWQGKTTTTQPGTGDTNTFNGFTVLDIIVKSKKVTALKGDYFTDRQPQQTKGTISLTFDPNGRINSFK